MIKWILGVLLALSVVLTAKVGWQHHQLGRAYDTVNESLMSANLELGKAETKFADANAYIGELEKELQTVIKDKNEYITRYGQLEVEYRNLLEHSGNAEIVYVDGQTVEVPAELNLIRGLLYEAVTEKTIVPVKQLSMSHSDYRLDIGCFVNPYPNSDRQIPMEIKLQLHLLFYGQLVETRTPTGAVNYYLNLYEMDDKGNKIAKLELKKFEVIVEKPTKLTFMWWNPKLDVGLFAGVTDSLTLRAGGDIGISFMSYGLTKNDLLWRFGRVGLNLTSDSVGLSLVPVQWNVGSAVLPLVDNLWIGPYGSISLDTEKSLGLMLSVSL